MIIKDDTIKVNGNNLIFLSLVVLIFIVSLPLTTYLPGKMRVILQMGSVCLFFLGLLFHKNGKFFLYLFLLIILTGCYYFGAWNLVMKFSAFNFNAICCWIFLIAGVYFIKNTEQKKTRILLYIIIAISILTAFTTIIGLMKYPLAARELGKGGDYLAIETKRLYRRMNIAGWSQIYGMVMIMPMFLILWKRKNKWFYLFFAVICELSIIFSQLTYAVLISFVAAFLILFDRTKSRPRIIFNIFVCLTAIFILLNLESLIQWMIDISVKNKFSMLSIKLQDLYNLLFHRVSTGDATARFLLYQISIETFLKHPLGNLLSFDINIADYGFHSELFDFIACFGIAGIAIIVIFIKKYLKMIKKSDLNNKHDIVILFIIFGGLFLFNPVFYSPQIFLGTFLVPVLVDKSLTCKMKYRKETPGLCGNS